MNSKIFVFYPRGVQTGGPEALHQLVDALRTRGQLAFLVPTSKTREAARVESFRHYNAPEASEVEDSAENIVVSPEFTFTDLAKVRRATKAVWWLSIDFSPAFDLGRLKTREHTFEDLMRAFAKRVLRSDYRAFKKITRRQGETLHFAQSQYAWSYLFSRLGVVPSMLSDYTLAETGIVSPQVARSANQVAYNPKKGAALVAALRPSFPEVNWTPIIDMSREEVLATLRTSTIYLESGHLPGKDRMPREAALMGAVSIIARRGAGAYTVDFPVPSDHRYLYDTSSVSDVRSAIQMVLRSPEEARRRQDSYVDTIISERKIFFSQVEQIFIYRRLGLDSTESSNGHFGSREVLDD